MDLLSVKGLTKQYPSFVLENISFTLPPGKIMGVIGKNGAGKSTTLKAILNMVVPDSGEVSLFGKSFKKHEIECKQYTGVVLGEVDFYKNKKLSDITGVTKRFYSHWDSLAYEKYLKEFELDESKRVNQLSSGMKVKYMLALALSHDAKLFILDEPTSGLDPVSRNDLLELFAQLVKDGTRSILYSTHITSDLEKCADRIVYIKEGKLLANEEKGDFIQKFQYLKGEDEIGVLSLEEIMIRTERKTYHV